MSKRSQEWSTLKTVVVWALQVLTALAFVASGGSKIAGAESMVELFNNIGIGQWFRYVTGIIEVAGGALALYPRLAWVGAGLLACTMVGAIITHLFVVGGSIVAPLVLLVLVLAVAWFRRP